jgi:hypothetical protein
VGLPCRYTAIAIGSILDSYTPEVLRGQACGSAPQDASGFPRRAPSPATRPTTYPSLFPFYLPQSSLKFSPIISRLVSFISRLLTLSPSNLSPHFRSFTLFYLNRSPPLNLPRSPPLNPNHVFYWGETKWGAARRSADMFVMEFPNEGSQPFYC